jgi:hypothetical protein
MKTLDTWTWHSPVTAATGKRRANFPNIFIAIHKIHSKHEIVYTQKINFDLSKI